MPAFSAMIDSTGTLGFRPVSFSFIKCRLVTDTAIVFRPALPSPALPFRAVSNPFVYLQCIGGAPCAPGGRWSAARPGARTRLAGGPTAAAVILSMTGVAPPVLGQMHVQQLARLQLVSFASLKHSCGEMPTAWKLKS